MSAALLKSHDLFLHPESKQHLPLSNRELFESLRLAAQRVATGSRLTEEDSRRVRMAREDISVRKNGLDPKYARFLSSVADSNSAKLACLLSIL